MLVTLLMVVIGLGVLLGGGAITVRGAVSLARCLGVSPLMIGMTIIAFGTSAPELMVSIQAVLSQHPDIVLGNVVGSNVANILLIVGVAAAIKTMLAPGGSALRRDYTLLLIFTVIFAGLSCLGSFSWESGALMVVGLIAYTTWSFKRSQGANGDDVADAESVEELGQKPLPLGASLLLTTGGICGVILGAYLLLEGSVDLARMWGVSEVVIGLTVIAIGTSLPELATSVMAALRGHPSIAIGNVIGSNLFNMFGITGVAAVVSESPLHVPAQVAFFDLWVMLGATLFICVILLKGWSIARLGGLAMIALYVFYIAILFERAPLGLAA